MNIPKNLPKIGPVLITMAAVLWAVDGIVRRSLYSLPPIVIVFYEHLIGLLLILPMAWPRLLKLKYTPKILGLTVIIALLSGLLGTLWFTSALIQVNYIPFSVVFLLQKLQPLFAISTAALLLKERLSDRYLLWAGLALIAAFFVTFPNGMVNWATGAGTFMAALLAFGAAAAWGTSTTFSKLLLKETDETTATGLRFLATTVFALVAVFVMGAGAMLTAVDISQWARFFFIALSTGMVALWIYYRGLARTEAKISTILELTFPMLAVFIDAIVYQTWLQPTQYLAALVLMVAMFKLSKTSKATPVPATPAVTSK